MDSCDTSVDKEVLPKSKQKKKSLCQMFMNKKTKVGCFVTSRSNENKEFTNRNSKNENSNQSLNTSTKLSLCCAITERSRTPPQSLTVAPLSPTLTGTCMESEVVVHSENYQTDVVVRNVATASLSADNTRCSKKNDKFVNSKDRQSILVEENSSFGSTSPSIPVNLRKKILHRRSVDNLIMKSPTNSMKHSSQESIKSAPIHHKTRSTSQDALTGSRARPLTNYQNDGVSMDSLAKQSLLAAQVLNLIPTQKARARNYLHGRIAANSLLGPVELEKVLPNREIKVFIGTWNMNGQTPPKELNDFMLPPEIETVPDVLVIGTQESCSEKTEWEGALQETVGPSHVLLTSASLGTLHLALFLRRDLIWFCSIPEEDSFSTRTGSAFRTKGAVAIALIIFGTSFLFVTSHLTAHQEKVKERVNDIKRIIRNLELPKDLPTRHKSKDVTQNFDCVFWCGDLNFRLSQPREEVIQWVSDTRFPRSNPVNLQTDQLRIILSDGSVFRGFEEAPINFPPTYKYDPGTQNFDSSNKQRTPAYTDRILFKGKSHSKGYIRRLSHELTASSAQKDGVIECLIYDSVPSICTSDHKPVWGVFRTILRPGIDTIPLAAGLFNREIYLEGIRRRAAAWNNPRETSKICSLQ